jgi:hypothetical protein
MLITFSVLAGTVVLALVALHAYASWTIRNLDSDAN